MEYPQQIHLLDPVGREYWMDCMGVRVRDVLNDTECTRVTCGGFAKGLTTVVR